MSLYRRFSSTSTLLAILLSARVLPAHPRADLLLLHGHILTLDAKDSVAQAIAIRHGIIVKVGSDGEVLTAGFGTILPC